MGRSDVLKFARGARNARAVIRFFIFNVLNKIVNQKPKIKNATVKLLWKRNSVVASELLAHMFYSNQSVTIL